MSLVDPNGTVLSWHDFYARCATMGVSTPPSCFDAAPVVVTSLGVDPTHSIEPAQAPPEQAMPTQTAAELVADVASMEGQPPALGDAAAMEPPALVDDAPAPMEAYQTMYQPGTAAQLLAQVEQSLEDGGQE